MMVGEVDISKALAVGGWMTERELLWLAQQAQARDVIVEIGSYLGRSTHALADHARGKVFAFDDWYGPRDSPTTLTELNRAFLFDIFQFNVQDIPADKLQYVKCDHKSIPFDIQPDMVFIDGGHEYENVRFDIEYWMPKLKVGGVISGHDYDDNFPDVKQAVTEMVPGYRIAPGTSIWYAIKE